MWTTESIIELRIDSLENRAYGWDAGFLERPGDSVSNGVGVEGIAECVAGAANDLPDNSLVEIRIDGICVGTWRVHALHTRPSEVAADVAVRLRLLDAPA